MKLITADGIEISISAQSGTGVHVRSIIDIKNAESRLVRFVLSSAERETLITALKETAKATK